MQNVAKLVQLPSTGKRAYLTHTFNCRQANERFKLTKFQFNIPLTRANARKIIERVHGYEVKKGY